jgi:hypothetical protein
LKKATERVDEIAKDGQTEIRKVVKSAHGGAPTAGGADRAEKAADKSTGNAGGKPSE